MSDSAKITEWKKKAEIDYFPLFMALWLSFDIWLSDTFQGENQRECIEKFKANIPANKIYKKMREFLIDSENEKPNSMVFKSNLRGLLVAMDRAEINYDEKVLDNDIHGNIKKRFLSFKHGLVDKDKKEYENLLMDANTLNKYDDIELSGSEYESYDLGLNNTKYEVDIDKGIKISQNLFLLNDIEKICIVFIEIAYQARCRLFHGQLEPNNKEHEAVIKFLYLTLKDLMENI